MGLDITAYRRLTPAPDAELDSDGCPQEWDRYVRLRENSDFPAHAEGVAQGVVQGFADSFGFRAGSYSGYDQWRDRLAQLVGWNSAEACWQATSGGRDGPFRELINFSDCEGVIGPAVAAKLAKDFADWDERARTFGGFDGWFVEQYERWRKAFEMAADGGAVDFH
jgi:hypothetical protein